MAIKQLPGVHVLHAKNTNEKAPVRMPAPSQVVVPMSQHIGAPCEPLVKVGDLVTVGQVIGEATAAVSSPIHASVSGKVTAIDLIMMPDGKRHKAVTIKSDGEQTLYEGITPPIIADYDGFVAAVRASGAVGLGGAGFPTSIKLLPPDMAAVDTLVINGAECEPYITSDYQIMMHRSDFVMSAVGAICKFMGIRRVVIGIEDNKPEAIAHFEKLTAGDTDFTVHVLKSLYPKGAEKVLIYEVTGGRVVEEGKLPSDVGCIVLNVGTLAFIGEYLATGVPLVEKMVTVDGGAIADPQNVIVPIGVSVREIAEFAGGYKSEPCKIIMGGPMMGMALKSDNFPLVKQNNAILFFNEKEAAPPKETACIHCGRCVRACPYNLMPLFLEQAFKLGNVDELNKLKINLCMECGCCSFACPAKRNLVASHRLAKQLVRETQSRGEKLAN